VKEQLTAFRTCPFCEATCGLELTIEDGTITRIRGDADDVFSQGFVCPKGASLKALHEDPDRILQPLIKQADGSHAPATWDEAFELIQERLVPILEEHGRDAVGAYLGNPSAHHLGPVLYGRALLKALGSKNVFTASTVDQMPKQVSVGLMFGAGLSVPVPDLDNTDHLLILGANPLASNGSLLTAPDMRGRLRGIQERGGKVVVFDPRRSRTAEEASEHHFIRPGTDALLLAALANVIFAEGLDGLGDVAEHVAGLDEVRAAVADFSPAAVAPVCGIAAEEIERIARELATAKRAAVYGRIGTCTQEFGTLASWLVDVLNTITGNLDRTGGAMFPKAPAGQTNSAGEPGKGRGVSLGRWGSRVRGLPEAFGELPVACMAEEIETPGEGQVRALITLAGNPVVSTPNAERLDRALDGLEFMVSVDIYLNETTRHADVILPAPSPLEHSHFDLAFYQLSIRNIAHYSPPTFDPPHGMPDEWETLLRLMGVVAGQGAHADVDQLDDFVAATLVQREVASPHSPVSGRDAGELMAELAPRRGPDRLLDFMLRTGPYGDGFGARNGDSPALTLAKLEEAPHGVDLGPLQPRIPEMLRTPSGKIELAPEAIVADVERLSGALGRVPNGEIVLIGRRDLRSNNSWMHNLELLVKGKDRCTAWVNPADAERFGLTDGEPARVTSAAGSVEVPVEVTDAIMPGVISIPHGWGHDRPGAQLRVAAAHAGTNSNILADETAVDPLSGNAVLNGIPVELAPVAAGDLAVAAG
jgi:anaerobic selenocysteine-containing dehydrogenase